MPNFSRLLVIFFNIFFIFSTTRNVEAPPPDAAAAQLEASFTDFERRADELLESGREFFMELLQDETARRTVGVIILSFKYMVEDESCSLLMMSVSQQIKDTLINGDKGSISVMHITDATVQLFTNALIVETFKTFLTSCQDIIRMPETPVMVDQVFDIVYEISQMERGADLVQAVEDGIRGITRRPKPQEYVTSGFTNLKYLMLTQTKDKVFNFVTG